MILPETSSARPSMHRGQKPPEMLDGSAVPHSRQVAGEVIAVIYKSICAKTLLANFEEIVASHLLSTDMRCLTSSSTSASQDTVSATF